jgi:hypothetical protein
MVAPAPNATAFVPAAMRPTAAIVLKPATRVGISPASAAYRAAMVAAKPFVKTV